VTLCSLCGEKWFSGEVVESIEIISADVRKRQIKFELVTFNVA